ncbi:retrovirus-related pol polyprotein from transposon TNT 1-94 [Tanacetum coccineum]
MIGSRSHQVRNNKNKVEAPNRARSSAPKVNRVVERTCGDVGWLKQETVVQIVLWYLDPGYARKHHARESLSALMELSSVNFALGMLDSENDPDCKGKDPWAPLFLWAEAINTACYTQNRSLICLRYNKTPYELMQDKKPDLSFFHVFGSLCYPTNDHEDLGKFDAKADIRIFVGYAPAKKAFRIYNRRTRIISETIHVTFDELTAMASEQFSSGPGLHYMTPATSSTGLVSNPVSQQPCIPPNRDDWDCLFQPMFDDSFFDEYFNPPPITVSPIQEAAALRAEVLADSPMSNSIVRMLPQQVILITRTCTVSISSLKVLKNTPKTPNIPYNPLNESPQEDSISQGSSSNMRQLHTPFEHLGRWTKDHPISNVIGDPSRSVSTRKQLETDARIESLGELVPYLDNMFLIKLKWIYKVKTDESGGVLKNKARLVAQGFRQEEGINFEESFAPVARILD